MGTCEFSDVQYGINKLVIAIKNLITYLLNIDKNRVFFYENKRVVVRSLLHVQSNVPGHNYLIVQKTLIKCNGNNNPQIAIEYWVESEE